MCIKDIVYKIYYVQYFRSFHLYHELDIIVQSQSYSIKYELWLIWTVNSTPGRTAKTIAFRRLGPGLDTVDLNQHILLLLRLGHYSLLFRVQLQGITAQPTKLAEFIFLNTTSKCFQMIQPAGIVVFVNSQTAFAQKVIPNCPKNWIFTKL